jgi:methyl-accepting chemotaxis protein
VRNRRRLPLGFQVWLGVGGLLGLAVGSIAAAVVLMIGLAHHETRINDRVVPYASSVDSAALAAKGVANDERGFLMTGDRSFIVEADRRVGRAHGWFAAAAAAASGAAQREAVAEARAGFDRWAAAVRREFATSRTGDRRGATAASLGPNRALRKRYEAALGRAQALGAGAIRSEEASVTAASGRSIAIVLACLLATLVIGVAVAYWLVRSIAVPVARLVTILGR